MFLQTHLLVYLTANRYVLISICPSIYQSVWLLRNSFYIKHIRILHFLFSSFSHSFYSLHFVPVELAVTISLSPHKFSVTKSIAQLICAAQSCTALHKCWNKLLFYIYLSIFIRLYLLFRLPLPLCTLIAIICLFSAWFAHAQFIA